ncbi:hypothetical protein KIW84_025427 [Lathyrus oleraceus]|uniref:Uncharacterized protein n=1 Tax=Pisum sativum TaxID=3888 RepID=A0A9D5B8Y6_PEA|nr:hypothetical protein KIW84_025427 [Pisum sativum]
MTEFNEFISVMDLFYLPLVGSKFTWSNATGDSMSRLNRFLTIEGLIEKWSINGQFMGNKVISDHCPVMIGASHLDWGPKTFKFFSMWIGHPNFLPLVEET